LSPCHPPRQPTVFYDRLPDRLAIDSLSEELVLILLPEGYRIAVGWFGSLEGDGHFELGLTGRLGGELYRRRFGRDPLLVREMLDLILEMYTDEPTENRRPAARSA
jgi:hypothetical protein